LEFNDMSKTFFAPGKVIDYVVVGANVLSGDVLVLGSLVGVAAKDALIGEVVAVDIEGIFTLPKTTGTAHTLGMPLYWEDTTNKTITTDGSGANKFIGYCADPAISAATSSKVLLARPGI
jgi:predicted RecA/RadA family phage recombinase